MALPASEGNASPRRRTVRPVPLPPNEVSDWPLAAILYTDVAKDGMMQGPNLEHTRALAEAGPVPVIASGGVGDISHIRALRDLPVWGVIVGRSLYEGTVNLEEAIRVAASL